MPMNETNQNVTTIPRMLTIGETAEASGLTYRNIREFIRKGKISYVKIGCKYLCNFDSLLSYLAKGDNADE